MSRGDNRVLPLSYVGLPVRLEGEKHLAVTQQASAYQLQAENVAVNLTALIADRSTT
jgi:hypothetical protein